MVLFDRHHPLWEKYIETIGENSELDKENFNLFVKREDPYFYGMAQRMAPVLYFDFVGLNKEYVLETIEIETINFNEYKGGGFFQNNAWYDIELKHEEGIHTYAVNKKLRFVGSGRAELRFWSDNYYKNVGLSPMGCFTINIKFNFIYDGKKVSVQTNPFLIDV
jgi:hypothetical protein